MHYTFALYIIQNNLLNESIPLLIFLSSFSVFILLMNIGHIDQEFSGCQRWRPGHARGTGKWIQRRAGKMAGELLLRRWALPSVEIGNMSPCFSYWMAMLPLSCLYPTTVYF